MTYSLDFRRKVLSVREKEGLTIADVAARFCVGVATVVRWLQRVEPQRTRYKPATKIDRIALARDVREYPDAYQSERAKRLGVSEKGIGHALRRMNITYKKNTAASQGGRRRTACLLPEDRSL
jgi:transposase